MPGKKKVPALSSPAGRLRLNLMALLSGKDEIGGNRPEHPCPFPMIRNTLSLTVDIEDWYHIPSVTGSPFSVYRDTEEFFSVWSGRYDYLTVPAAALLALLDANGITATFFVVGEVAERYPGLVERIVEGGHEIACHGLHHGCKIDPLTKRPLIDPQEFERRTERARSLLGHLAREPVTGYRAPNALVGGWMVDSLERLGFRYDSSVSANSLYNKTDSALTGVNTVPYYPGPGGLEPGGPRGIVEFPFARWDIAGLRIPASGGPLLRFLGAGIMARGLLQSLRRGHTVFYIHPLDLATERFPEVGRGRPFYWLIKGSMVERRFRAILTRLKDVRTIPLREAREALP